MNPTALLLIAATSAFAPLLLSRLAGGTEAAWNYVCTAIEAAALWAYAGATHAEMTAKAIAAWGYMEAAMRALGRLAFPMDHPVRLQPGQGLADAAFGFPATWLSAATGLVVAWLVSSRSNRGLYG